MSGPRHRAGDEPAPAAPPGAAVPPEVAVDDGPGPVRPARSLAHSGGINLGAGLLGAAANLLLAVVIGRSLGVDGAGVYFLVVAAAVIVANTAELGADTGLVRFVAAARATGRSVDVRPMVRAAVRPVALLGLVVVAIGAVVALLVPPDVPATAVLLAAVGAAMLSQVALQLAVSRGFSDPFAYPLVQNLLVPVGRLALAAGVALVGGGVVDMMAAWSAPVLVALVVAALVTRRHLRNARRDAGRVDPDPTIGRQLWRFSGVRGVGAAVEIMLEWADVLLVGALAGPAAAGVYAVVTRCVRASEVVQQAARLVVAPVASGAFARGDLVTLARLQELVTAAMIWLAWPFFIVLALYGDLVLGWFGAEFTSGWRALIILAGALAVQTAAGAVQTILLMAGRSQWQLYDKTASLLAMVALDIVLVPRLGLTGAAVAWAVVLVVETAVVVWQVRHLVGVRSGLRHPLAAAAVTLLSVGVPAVLVRELMGSGVASLAVAVLAAGAVHVLLGWLTRRQWGAPQLLTLRDAA